MRDENELYPEDLQRVKKVTSSGIHSVPRKSFKPWKMILMVMVVLAVLMAVSQIIARVVGAV